MRLQEVKNQQGRDVGRARRSYAERGIRRVRSHKDGLAPIHLRQRRSE